MATVRRMRAPKHMTEAAAVVMTVLVAGSVAFHHNTTTKLHPATRHVGTWPEPPKLVPSPYFVDCPIVGNGDLGICASAYGAPLALHLGANGYWSSSVWVDLPLDQTTQGGDEYYSMTRIGTVTMFSDQDGKDATWAHATQELYAARVNVTLDGSPLGNTTTFATVSADNTSTNIFVVQVQPSAAAEITISLQAPNSAPNSDGGAPPLPVETFIDTSHGVVAFTRDAVTDVQNSLVMQTCVFGGQRNTSQIWETLDGSQWQTAGGQMPNFARIPMPGASSGSGNRDVQGQIKPLSNLGRCIVDVAGASGFPGTRRLSLTTGATKDGNECTWGLAPAPVKPISASPSIEKGGRSSSYYVLPNMIVPQPPMVTGHCNSSSTCLSEVQAACRSTHGCTAFSIDPTLKFYELSNGTASLDFLPNYNWTSYISWEHNEFQVLTNGSHCAMLRGDGEPYLVPSPDCNAALFFAKNMSVADGLGLASAGGKNSLDRWSCLTAVEPNPLVRSTVACTVVGAQLAATPTADNFTANLTVKAQDSQPFSIVCAVPVVDCGVESTGKGQCDTLSQARQVLAAQGDPTKLKAQHDAQWQSYWSRMQVDLGPSYRNLEGFYYGMQYQAGSAMRPGKNPPGLWGPWITSDTPGWRGDFTTDYNYQASFFSVFSENRPELALPYFDNVEMFLPLGRWRASMPQWGPPVDTRGAGTSMNGFWGREQLTPSGHGFLPANYSGIQLPSHWSIFPHAYYGNDWGILAIGGFCAKAFIDYVEFTQDVEFLKQRAYPIVRGVADFYESYATTIDGRYNVLHSCAQEGCGQAGSETGKLAPHNNTPYDLAFYKRVFRSLLQWADDLDIDQATRQRWQQLLDNVADYPTAKDDSGQTVFAQANFTDGIPSGNNPECARYPIVYFNAMHPGEDIDLDADNATLDIAKNTVQLVNSYNQWSPTNGMCLAWPAAARVVANVTRLLANFQTAANTTMMNNFLPYIHNHPNSGFGCNMENSGSTVAINDLLASRHGHNTTAALRVLPGGWPADQPISFQNVRVKGAFLVSASAVGSGPNMPAFFVEPVSVVSLAGVRLVFVDPFQNSTAAPTVVDVTSHSKVQLSRLVGSTQPKYAFNTTSSTTYAISAAAL